MTCDEGNLRLKKGVRRLHYIVFVNIDGGNTFLKEEEI